MIHLYFATPMYNRWSEVACNKLVVIRSRPYSWGFLVRDIYANAEFKFLVDISVACAQFACFYADFSSFCLLGKSEVCNDNAVRVKW